MAHRAGPPPHRQAQTQHKCRGRKRARLPQGWDKQQDVSSSLHETHILFWAVTQSREILLQGRETRAPLCRSSRRVLLPNLPESPLLSLGRLSSAA